jgi:hypothetical protein
LSGQVNCLPGSGQGGWVAANGFGEVGPQARHLGPVAIIVQVFGQFRQTIQVGGLFSSITAQVVDRFPGQQQVVAGFTSVLSGVSSSARSR